MRSAFLSVLILAAAALASLGTQAQTSQPAQFAKPATQLTAQQNPPPSAAAPAAPSAPAAQSKPAAPVAPAQMTVVLDPAHGGPDSGARGPTGTAESDVVLDYARAIRVSLESQGFRVLFTREGNQDPSFDDRSALVNSLRDVVFISLHVSSTGPIGTVRAYSYFFPSDGPAADALSGQTATSTAAAPRAAPAPAPAHPALVQWDQAQRPYLGASQQLATLLQIQLAQKFNGSPEVPLVAAVRQLRSIAAPAIAVEVSSVAVTDPQQLARMGQPLADAISRAVIDFRSAGNAGARAAGGVR